MPKKAKKRKKKKVTTRKKKARKSRTARLRVAGPDSFKIYINGKLYDKEDAKITVFDHGLLYGDGVFEGIRVYNSLIFKLKEHIDRLYDSARAVMLEIPIGKRQMVDAIIKTLRTNRLTDAYIGLLVTRGEGDLGLDPRKCRDNTTIIIITDKVVLYPDRLYREGLSIIAVPTRRNIPEAINPQIKSLNYLNNVLAKVEAINSGAEEAVMLNQDGFVAECTGDNIFVVKNQKLLTPPVHIGMLKGITRGAVIELAEKVRIPFAEEVLTRHDLYSSGECFLTGTAAEIIPVIKIDGRVIGNGRPGPITIRLMRDFSLLTKVDGVRY